MLSARQTPDRTREPARLSSPPWELPADARRKIEAWRCAYDETHYHTARDWLASDEFARRCALERAAADSRGPELSDSERLQNGCRLSAIFDRLLHHTETLNIRGNSYRLKENLKASLVRAEDTIESRIGWGKFNCRT